MLPFLKMFWNICMAAIDPGWNRARQPHLRTSWDAGIPSCYSASTAPGATHLSVISRERILLYGIANNAIVAPPSSVIYPMSLPFFITSLTGNWPVCRPSFLLELHQASVQNATTIKVRVVYSPSQLLEYGIADEGPSQTKDGMTARPSS